MWEEQLINLASSANAIALAAPPKKMTQKYRVSTTLPIGLFNTICNFMASYWVSPRRKKKTASKKIEMERFYMRT